MTILFIESPRMNDKIAYDAEGGPGFNTQIVTTASGRESRNMLWPNARCAYDVGLVAKPKSLYLEILAFFRTVGGRAIGFRFKDHSDFECARDEGLLVRIGTTNAYQMQKRYAAGIYARDRLIQKPVAGTVKVWKLVAAVWTEQTTGFTIDTTTGIVTFDSDVSGDTLAWSGEFDVPVRFDTDTLPAVIRTRTSDTELLMDWPSIPLLEIRI